MSGSRCRETDGVFDLLCSPRVRRSVVYRSAHVYEVHLASCCRVIHDCPDNSPFHRLMTFDRHLMNFDNPPPVLSLSLFSLCFPSQLSLLISFLSDRLHIAHPPHTGHRHHPPTKQDANVRRDRDVRLQTASVRSDSTTSASLQYYKQRGHSRWRTG